MLEFDEGLRDWLRNSKRFDGLSKKNKADENIAKLDSLVDIVGNTELISF